MYHYRPDIDGLRAVAVIPVLLFHAGMNYFSGGYIGVDIFFVVSGYLITSIIVVELEKEKFTILGFYERRVRRIFPALFTVIFFCIIVSQFLMLPTEYKDFGQSVFATTFFLSNVLFWVEAGYFDAESLMKPLLHTWSLAVEEQYYIFYPPLLILIYKFLNKKGFPLIAGLWVLSLAWSVWSTYRYPSMAYYLAPSRVWELLTGAMLALGYVKQIESRSANELIGIAGMLMVGYAVFGFDHTTHFPGYVALIPCVGTAMVIYSGESHKTLVSRLLTSRALIFTGLISYSLYLWHWPILVFANLYQDKPKGPWQIIVLLGLAYLFAWVSWRFVEKPFRGKQSKYTRKQIFAGALTVMSGVSAFGLILHLTAGLPVRMPDHVNQIVDLMESYHSYLPENCLLKGGGKMKKDVSLCGLGEAAGNANKTPNAVLWGDSHAASLVPGLTKLSDRVESLSFKFIGMQGCPPLKGISVATNEDTRYDKCTEFNDLVLEKLLSDDSVKVVMLSAYWALYENGIRMPTDPNHGSVFLCETENCTALSTGNNRKFLKQGLQNIIGLLIADGKKVILIGPIPELEINGAATIARMELLDNVHEVRSQWKSVKLRIQGSIEVFNDLQDGKDIASIYPHRVLCGDDFCEVETKDMPLYNDRHHLSPLGSKFVLEELRISDILSSKLASADSASYLSSSAHDN